VRLPWLDGVDLVVQTAIFDNARIKVDFQEFAADRFTSIKVSLIESAEYGPFTSDIKVVTNDARYPEYLLPVRAYVEYPIELEEHVVAAGNMERDRHAWVEAVLRLPYGGDLEIGTLEYVSGSPGEWRLERSTAGTYKLEFQLSPPIESTKPVAIARVRFQALTGAFVREFEVEAMGIVQ